MKTYVSVLVFFCLLIGVAVVLLMFSGRAKPCYSAKSAKASFATKHEQAEPTLVAAKGRLADESREACPAPVGWWRFDESAGAAVIDSSGAGNHGQIINDMRAVARVPGRKGQALKFTAPAMTERNKAGCVCIQGLGAKYDFSRGLTIEAWIMPIDDGRHEQDTRQELVSTFEADRGKGFTFFIGWGRNSLSFNSGEGGAGKAWGVGSPSYCTDLRPERWHHAVGVYDGSRFRVYLDGLLIAESKDQQPLTKGRSDVFIGSFMEGFAYGFNGLIDDVKIYNYPIPSSKVLLMMLGG